MIFCLIKFFGIDLCKDITTTSLQLSVSIFFLFSLIHRLPCFTLILYFFRISDLISYFKSISCFDILLNFALKSVNSLFLSSWFGIFFYKSMYLMPIGIKRKSGGRRSSQTNKDYNKQRRCSQVQVLYNTCKEVFENCGPGIIPSPQNIQRLKDVMGMLIILFMIFGFCYLYMLFTNFKLLVCNFCQVYWFIWVNY